MEIDILGGFYLRRDDGTWTIYDSDGNAMTTFALDYTSKQAKERADWFVGGYGKGIQVGELMGRAKCQSEIKRALGIYPA